MIWSDPGVSLTGEWQSKRSVKTRFQRNIKKKFKCDEVEGSKDRLMAVVEGYRLLPLWPLAGVRYYKHLLAEEGCLIYLNPALMFEL